MNVPTSTVKHTKTPLVGFLTDFGLRDHYAGVIKAVVESICPGVQMIDITHDVESQNVSQAAYLIWASYRYFPAGSIIVAIVDPGVGGSRSIIGVNTNRHIFLAPNNGVLDLVLWEEQVSEMTTIQLEKAATRSMLPRNISATFHGRDVFAPLAAHLARGTRLALLGAKTPVDWVASPFVENKSSVADPRVLHVDKFGNVVTNIRSIYPGVRNRRLTLKAGKRRLETWAQNYASIGPGKASLIVGSSDLVEIVMNGRSAAGFLELKPGDALHIERKGRQ
jgi:hypothetical protein